MCFLGVALSLACVRCHTQLIMMTSYCILQYYMIIISDHITLYDIYMPNMTYRICILCVICTGATYPLFTTPCKLPVDCMLTASKSHWSMNLQWCLDPQTPPLNSSVSCCNCVALLPSVLLMVEEELYKNNLSLLSLDFIYNTNFTAAYRFNKVKMFLFVNIQLFSHTEMLIFIPVYRHPLY